MSQEAKIVPLSTVQPERPVKRDRQADVDVYKAILLTPKKKKTA